MKKIHTFLTLAAAMIAGGIGDAVPDSSLPPVKSGPLNGLDDAMGRQGIGAFNPALPNTSTPQITWSGEKNYAAILANKGTMPLPEHHEYAFKAYRMMGWPYAGQGQWMPRYYEWWHRASFAAADKQITFFNGNQSQFVTNFKSGEIPAGRPMWMQGIWIRPIDLNVTDGSIRGNYSKFSAAASTAVDNITKLQSMLSGGIVTFKNNSGRDTQLEVLGVDRFLPGGGSFFEHGSMSGTGIAAGYAATNMSNGGAKPYVGLVLAEPIPLFPGRSMSLVIDFQAANIPQPLDFQACVYGTEIVSAVYQ